MVPRPAIDPRHRLHLTRRFTGIALGVLGWLGYRLLSGSPALAEALAGVGPIPAARRGLSLLSGTVPFVVAELLLVLFLLRQIAGGVGGLRRVVRREVGAPRMAFAGLLRVGQDAGVLVFLFYLLWGFQYARPSLEDRLGFASSGELTAAELEPLARRAVEATNLLYREIHGSPDGGVPTPAPRISEAAVALNEGWARTQARFDFHPPVSRSHGAPKSFLATPILKRFGVAGMHIPYTGEALVLSDLPGVVMGIDLGHEMAHQRGFAREDEASVLGFLVASASDDLLLRYSAYNFLQRQLLSALQRVDSEVGSALSRALDPGVHRDAADLWEFWAPSRGVARAAANVVNDTMLRSHGVPEGVASYQGSVWILVALAQARGEEVLFEGAGL